MNPESLFGIATKIDTPLMLAGLVVLVLYALYKNRIPALQAKLLFVLALVAMVLGTVAFIYVPKGKMQYLLEGRVFSPPTSRASGLPDANVFLEVPGEIPLVRRTVTDQNGAFSFQITPGSFGKTGQYWVTAKGYVDSAPIGTTLSPSPDPLEIGLQAVPQAPKAVTHGNTKVDAQPAAAPQQDLPSLPACLEGVWPEQLVGRSVGSDTLKWNIHVQGTVLTLTRQDQFVHGTFAQSGTQWAGDLVWGNGETWHNVILSPTPDCQTVSTNQFWYYQR